MITLKILVQLRKWSQLELNTNLFSKVVKLEQCGPTFHLTLYQCGRLQLKVATAKEMFTETLCNYRAHLENLSCLKK